MTTLPTVTELMHYELRYWVVSKERKEKRDWMGAQIPVDLFYKSIDTGELNENSINSR